MMKHIKRQYKLKLYPFTFKYLNQFKRAYGFKSIDITLQWLINFPDKKQLMELTRKRIAIDTSYKHLLINAKEGKK